MHQFRFLFCFIVYASCYYKYHERLDHIYRFNPTTFVSHDLLSIDLTSCKKNNVSIRLRFHRGLVRIIVFDLELKLRWTEAPYCPQTAIEMQFFNMYIDEYSDFSDRFSTKWCWIINGRVLLFGLWYSRPSLSHSQSNVWVGIDGVRKHTA